MNRIAHAMAEGDYSVRTELARQDELGQLGDALDHLAVSLGKAAEESNRLEQMRRDFIANVSHEFRTRSPSSADPQKPCSTGSRVIRKKKKDG
jgi:signal transduction histidine kinase